jgi:hypothetical protein
MILIEIRMMTRYGEMLQCKTFLLFIIFKPGKENTYPKKLYDGGIKGRLCQGISDHHTHLLPDEWFP